MAPGNFNLQFFLCTSNPSTHPFITDKEKAYLQQEIGQLERDKNASSPPWRAIFSSVPVIALIIDMVSPAWTIKAKVDDIFLFFNLSFRAVLQQLRIFHCHERHSQIHERHTPREC